MLRNFRFAIDDQLAGMAHPGDGPQLQDNLIELQAYGIQAIISLDEYGLDTYPKCSPSVQLASQHRKPNLYIHLGPGQSRATR